VSSLHGLLLFMLVLASVVPRLLTSAAINVTSEARIRSFIGSLLVVVVASTYARVTFAETHVDPRTHVWATDIVGAELVCRATGQSSVGELPKPDAIVRSEGIGYDCDYPEPEARPAGSNTRTIKIVVRCTGSTIDCKNRIPAAKRGSTSLESATCKYDTRDEIVILRSVESCSGPAAEGLGAAEKTLPEFLYHYTSEEVAPLIENSALGQPGQVLYLTPNGGLSPVQAGIELALPQTSTAGALFRVPTSVLDTSQIIRIGPVTVRAPAG